MMMQLTTIKGIKTPIDSDRSGKYAFITRSTMVVNAAIIIMNMGIRTEEGITFLKSDMTISEKRITNVIARPIPMPLDTLEVTAKAEHNPIINIRRGFS
jgi:hypothetical protein